MIDFYEKKALDETKNNFMYSAYSAWQIGRFLGTCKTKTFTKYLDVIGLNLDEEKLTKEESEEIKKHSMSVVEKISKMNRVKKGSINGA